MLCLLLLTTGSRDQVDVPLLNPPSEGNLRLLRRWKSEINFHSSPALPEDKYPFRVRHTFSSGGSFLAGPGGGVWSASWENCTTVLYCYHLSHNRSITVLRLAHSLIFASKGPPQLRIVFFWRSYTVLFVLYTSQMYCSMLDKYLANLIEKSTWFCFNQRACNQSISSPQPFELLCLGGLFGVSSQAYQLLQLGYTREPFFWFGFCFITAVLSVLVRK